MIEMLFTQAKILRDEGGEWLCLRPANPAMAREFCYKKSPDKPYSALLKAYRKKRSLDANAYAWALISEIAQAVHLDKTAVYRNAIREIGGNSETVCVPSQAAQKLCEGWAHNGLGWFGVPFASKLPGCTNVTLYYGSSTYDTLQMSLLIDHLVEDAEALGLETATPAELARLKEEWQ